MPLPKDTLFFGLAKKLTNEQQTYVDSIFDSRMTIVNAPSGTGKTTLAVASAKLLNKPLVYIFSPVEEGKMGFRPGTQKDKEREYLLPLIDALKEIGENPDKVIFDEDNFEAMKRGDAWVFPMSHVFARGTNIKNSTVILGECQNYTRGELKKVLTRLHDTNTIILEGHDGQCDLKDESKSGFVPYLEHYKHETYVNVCRLSVNFRGEVSQHADKLRW